jgi:hypothetical protein
LSIIVNLSQSLSIIVNLCQSLSIFANHCQPIGAAVYLKGKKLIAIKAILAITGN